MATQHPVLRADEPAADKRGKHSRANEGRQSCDDGLLISLPVEITGRVEIVRSFSYKLNAGSYESRDFFCSQKVTCDASVSDVVSTMIADWCEAEVLRTVKAYITKIEKQRKGAA